MHLQDLTAARMWNSQEKEHDISVLKMKAVQLALNALVNTIMGETLVLMSNNVTVVAS